MLRHSGRRIGFGLAVIALVSGAGLMLRAEPPQEVGTWASIGASPEDRVGATSVALPDGRTVIAGGLAGGIPTDAVVLFDPETGSFSAIGQLTAPRTGHTATLLEDGSIMIAGGTVNELLTADIEIYDLSTGTATPAATMTELRSGHAAARLPNGSVRIAGGSGPDGALQSAEIFDPAAGTSAVTSPLLIARTSASATSLIDGRVLIAGGSDGTKDLLSAEIFDPASQSFQPTDTNLTEPRSGHTAVLLPHNNSVLIAGGTSNGVPLATVDLFLPAEFPDPFSYGMGQFTPTDEMAAPRSGAAGGPHVEGYAYVTGGGTADAEVYRFATIKTDKDDYAPEQTAIITGSGWQPNEDVTLRFQEDPAVHDDYVLTVTADDEGNIHYDQWAPEWHDLGVRFYLMATQGDVRAQTTFTDALNVDIDTATFAWHRTGEVSGGFNVPVSGIYTCTAQMGGNNCTVVTDITITAGGSTGSKVITGLTDPATDAAWGSVNLEFRTVPGAGQVTIPATDGRYSVTAALNTNAPNSPTQRSVNNYFGVDNTAPVTSIQCNGAACTNPYSANVQVQLSASDGTPSNASGVASRVYCVDTADTCTPATPYTGGAGFPVAFNAGVTYYVRYFSADNVGNVETTKSQAIQFQAATVSITVNTAPAGRSFTVDGTAYTSSQTFSWTPGSNHTIETTSPQSGVAGTGYLWTTWSDGGAISHTVTAPSSATTYTANFKTQHEVTFTAGGTLPIGGTSDTGTNTVVTVNGDATTAGILAFSEWVDAGSPVTYAYAATVNSASDSGKRYALTTPAPTPASGFSVTGPLTVTGTYKTQYHLTFTASGLPIGGTNDTGTNAAVTVNGVPQAASALAFSDWFDEGSDVTYAFAATLASATNTDKRYVLTTPDPAPPSPIDVTGSHTVTGTYKTQYQLTFTAAGTLPIGGASDTGGNTVVTINGTAQTAGNLAFSDWFDADSEVTYEYEAAVASTSTTGKRYALTTPPPTPASGFTVTGALTVTGTYKTQYEVTFTAGGTLPIGGASDTGTNTVMTVTGNAKAAGILAFSEWFDAGSPVTYAYEALVNSASDPGKRYALTTPAPTPASGFSVTGPLTITGTYKTQYQLTFTASGLPIGGASVTGANTVVTVAGYTKTAATLPFSPWFDKDTNVSYSYSTPISTDPVSSTQYELTNSGSLTSPVSVTGAMTITGNYSTNLYTIQYQTPLDESTATSALPNTGKNGRVIPVKVLIFKNGVAISDTSVVMIKVVGATCSGGTGADPIEGYADAGASSGNSNLFRWSSPHWIYNLDTRALGLVTNNCYRLDAYLTATSGPTAVKASYAKWAIFKPVK